MSISDMNRKDKAVFGEDHQDPSYGLEGLVDEVLEVLECATNGHEVFKNRREIIQKGLRRMKYEELNRLFTVLYFIIHQK